MTGLDVGGTKVHIADTSTPAVQRYDTADYPDMDTLLEDYFQSQAARPLRMTVGMAGPRDDDTGEIKLTNHEWPVFDPMATSQKYGVEISTANDMVITAAGVLEESKADLIPLKDGTPTRTGTQLVVALSTGVGAAAAVWDPYSKRRVIVASEGGHIGFQPKTEAEQDYLSYMNRKYPHASAELALSGKHGFHNLVEHILPAQEPAELSHAIDEARQAERPVGPVLVEYALNGDGADRRAAQAMLQQMGSMVGSVIRDLTLAFKATGGVYLTGSVALAQAEYYAAHTGFNERFVRKGAVHDKWLENVPINLVTNPNVAVLGALALAKGL